MSIGEPIALSDAGVVSKGEKKAKTKKKDGRKEKVESAEGCASGAGAMDVDVPEGDQALADEEKRRREKKEKKKKRKLEEMVQAAGGEPKQEEPTEAKKSKKHKYEKEDGAMVEQAAASAEGKEKKKKRKHKDVDGTKDGALKKKSKVKAKPADSVPSASNASASTGASSQATTTEPTANACAQYLASNSITVHTSATSGPVTPIISFAQLNSIIPEGLHSSVAGFKEPTPIQACSWPAALRGCDVVGIAETGSGKTLAFGLPAVARLVSSPTTQPTSSSSKKSKSKAAAQISVLVMAPTRELALQTHETLCNLGAPFGMTSVAVYGGVDKEPQKRALAGHGAGNLRTTMVVGTPGRILDLVNEGVCDLSQVTYLVLDEADRMLDKGFENDIRAIISHTAPSADRQTLMFSATWPDSVRRLASSFQRDPVRVTVGSDDLTANRRVEQIVEVFDDQREKDSRLTSHLRALQHKKTTLTGSDEARILVFVLYKKEATRVENTLRRQGYSVAGIHGDLSQSARIEALENFKTGKTGLLVATDVAARGLDIPNVGAVINYSFPLTIEDYIHRIGRTGRGGRSGKSITFFTGDNHERALAGELARVLRESGFEAEGLKKFPMTIKKKTHSAYGAFYRDDIPTTAVPTRLKF